jgi:hypothetical protein
VTDKWRRFFDMRLLVTGRQRSGTTITRHILNSHPDIWLTNELLLYDFFGGHGKFKSFRKWVKKRFKKTYRQERYAFPFDIDASSFKRQYKETLGSNTSLSAKITSAEICIFQKQYKIFGDKGGLGAISALQEARLPFKMLYLFRDGRDSVASSISRNKGKKDNASWKTSDPFESSLHWANALKKWFELKALLNKDDYLEIQFEQFVKNPGETLGKIANFLEVEDRFDRHIFDNSKAHTGRYKRQIPDWRDTFSKEAIEVLKELKYI